MVPGQVSMLYMIKFHNQEPAASPSPLKPRETSHCLIGRQHLFSYTVLDEVHVFLYPVGFADHNIGLF